MSKREPVSPAAISALRQFNRLYTQKIGVLSAGLLESPFSLTEARVLFELANREQSTAGEIGLALGLDAGYLSRIVRKFERLGLLKRRASDEDARRSLLTLTQKGRAAFSMLDSRSSEQAKALLETMSHEHRDLLLSGIRNVGRSLGDSSSNDALVVLRPHRPGDMGWVIARHGEIYSQEYGWDERFEALVARIAADFIDNYDPKRERCWIAERSGERVGAIFLVRHPEEKGTAKLRMLFVDPSARGIGLGRTLVDECIRFARTAGYRKVMLWTDSILTAARHIYQSLGFQLVREEKHNSFGKNLTGQFWELELK